MQEHTAQPAGSDFGLELYTIMPQPDFWIAPGFVGAPYAAFVPGGTTYVADGATIGTFGFALGLHSGLSDADHQLRQLTRLRRAAALIRTAGTPGGRELSLPHPSEAPFVQGPDSLRDWLCSRPSVGGTELPLGRPSLSPTHPQTPSAAAPGPGAVLIARYVGVAPTGGLGTPVNILVWDGGTAGGYRTRTILGDPTVPTTPASFAPYCTPYTTDVDYQGADPTSTCPDNTDDGCTTVVDLLRQCNVPGPFRRSPRLNTCYSCSSSELQPRRCSGLTRSDATLVTSR